MFGDEDDDELNTFVTNLILNEARHRQNAYGVGGIDPYYSFPQPKILYKTDIKPMYLIYFFCS